MATSRHVGNYIIPEPILRVRSIHDYTLPEARPLLRTEVFQLVLQAYVELNVISRSQN
jgi:hypothetical protein